MFRVSDVGKEGPDMSRLELLRSMFDNSGLGVEIGPQARGIAPRRDGFNVRIVDYIPAGTLREMHAGTPEIDIAAIEEVDYVSGGAPLGEVIAERGYFDYVIASHVIEHVPDLVGFLKDCQSLLKTNGKLVLAVPDKRLCFDVFRPLTSIGESLDLHLRGITRHPPGKILDYWAYAAHRDGQWIVWNPGYDGPLKLAHPIATAKEQFEGAVRAEHYVDTHAWVFTPSSFRLLVSDLYEMGEVALRECVFQLPTAPDYYPEFYISLSQSAPGHGLSRNDLMLSILEECRSVQSRRPA
jgi:SAM-dependent methyltransferase